MDQKRAVNRLIRPDPFSYIKSPTRSTLLTSRPLPSPTRFVNGPIITRPDPSVIHSQPCNIYMKSINPLSIRLVVQVALARASSDLSLDCIGNRFLDFMECEDKSSCGLLPIVGCHCLTCGPCLMVHGTACDPYSLWHCATRHPPFL